MLENNSSYPALHEYAIHGLGRCKNAVAGPDVALVGRGATDCAQHVARFRVFGTRPNSVPIWRRSQEVAEAWKCWVSSGGRAPQPRLDAANVTASVESGRLRPVEGTMMTYPAPSRAQVLSAFSDRWVTLNQKSLLDKGCGNNSEISARRDLCFRT